MPELPEVETVRRALEAHLVGRCVTGVRLSGKRLRQPLPEEPLRGLVGLRFSGVRRRAKYLLLTLERPSAGPALASGSARRPGRPPALRGERVLLVHLGMTGNLLLRSSGGQHEHVVFSLDQGPPLVYADPRRFGLVLVLSPSELETCSHLCGLGAEPLDATFDAAYLRARCRDRTRSIKDLLMDGRMVAGLGNIYAAEALFRAGIRPTTPAGRLGRERLDRLASEIKAVLAEAIAAGGTTISDYQGAGDGGRFQQRLSVYGRAGERCLVCDGPVDSLAQAGRTTYFCRRCQR